jgi:hypothetical protein
LMATQTEHASGARFRINVLEGSALADADVNSGLASFYQHALTGSAKADPSKLH